MNLTVWKIGAQAITAKTLNLSELQVELVRPDVEAYNAAGNLGSIVYMATQTGGWYELYHVQETVIEVLAAADTSGYPSVLISVDAAKYERSAAEATQEYAKVSGTADTNTTNRLIDTANGDFINDGVLVGDYAHNLTDGGSAQIQSLLYNSTGTSQTANQLNDTSEDFVGDGTVAVGDIVFNTTDNTKGFVGAIVDLDTLDIIDAAGDPLDLFPVGTEAYQIFRAAGLPVSSATSLFLGDLSGAIPVPNDLFPDGDEDYQIKTSEGASQEWLVSPKWIVYAQARLGGATGTEIWFDGGHKMRPRILEIETVLATFITAANAGDDILESQSILTIDGRVLPTARTLAFNKFLVRNREANYLGSGDTAVWVSRRINNGSRTRRYTY